jgi:tetratricopeptide (TPR) repeat protein
MEPLLLVWRQNANTNFTQLHLSAANTLPTDLRDVLKERLPEALQSAHDNVLRDKELARSWIAFRQRVYRDTLNQLRAIKDQLDRIEAIVTNQAQTKTVWTIPQPTQHFQDRPDLIVQIDRALQQRRATALTALHGLGGIGKSQMARAFAHQRRDNYKCGVWIDAETTASLLAGLSALAPLLGIPPEPDQQAVAARVLNEISTRPPWLVIFDNAVSPDILRPYVNRLRGNGHVAITSRNESWDGMAQTVSITQWTIEDSARFLLDRSHQQDLAAAASLARDLDGLVLALEHAAAYILAADGMSIAEYHRIWHEELKWTAPKDHDYPRSVAAAIALSLDAVAQESPAAYDLLSTFAWLAPDRIPKKELLDPLQKSLADDDFWIAATLALRRHSLVKREPSEGPVTHYSIHRVVQEIMRDRQETEGSQSKWFTAACDLVSKAFPFDSDEPPFWPAAEALLPHAVALRKQVPVLAPPECLGRLLNQAGIYLQDRGLYEQSRDFQELALELALTQFGPNHSTVPTRRSNLAITLRRLGVHAEARKQIELALESHLRKLGPDHPSLAPMRSNLAIVLRNLGETSEARKQIELALESELRQSSPDHPRVAVFRSNLSPPSPEPPIALPQKPVANYLQTIFPFLLIT